MDAPEQLEYDPTSELDPELGDDVDCAICGGEVRYVGETKTERWYRCSSCGNVSQGGF